MSSINRRTFLKQSAAGTAAFSSLPLLSALSRTRPFKLCVIGTGWWGMNILREAIASKEVKVKGLCDVDRPALEKAGEEVKTLNGDRPKLYGDFREMLQKEKPEIVIIGTPDHWHALNAIACIEAGAHIYVEKPIAHTLNEGLAILKTARKYNRVVQVGTHRRVSPHNISGMEFLKSGKVGDIGLVKCFVNYGSGPGKPAEKQAIPDGLDWDNWCGPAPYTDYLRQIHPRGWRSFMDYANGTIADWGIHWFDQVLWWTEERYPTKVHATGGRYMRQDSSDAPDTLLATYEFEQFTLLWENKQCMPNANEDHNVGCYFYGTNGTFHMGWRDGWTFYPKKKSEQKINVQPQLHKPDDQNIKELWADFIQSIDNNTRPVCDIEHGYLATNISLLGVLSYKLGRQVEWDGKNHQILNDPEATAMMRREYRGEWEYPKV